MWPEGSGKFKNRLIGYRTRDLPTIEELLERDSSGSGLESREYGRRDPLRRPRDTLYPQKLAITSPRSGGCSIGIVCSRTEATDLLYSVWKRQETGSSEMFKS
jgi:hypothetical protein